METKSFWPFICSTPTILLWAISFYRAIFGGVYIRSTGVITAIMLLPVIGFAICVAMIFVKSDSREWKIAAIFNAMPIILALLAVLIMPEC
jgi:hypothetical protein